MGKVSGPTVLQPGYFKKCPRLESEVFMTCFLLIISGVCMWSTTPWCRAPSSRSKATGEASRGVSMCSQKACAHACVYVCRCMQGRGTPRPCSGRMDALGMAAGRGGLAGEVRGPGAGRRVGATGNTNPKPLFCFEFLQWQRLHWDLFMGQGANASPGPPTHPLCSAAEFCSPPWALGSSMPGWRATNCSDSPCC